MALTVPTAGIAPLACSLANAEDIDSFPLPLKRKLVILQWSFIGLVISMILLVVIGKMDLLH